VRELLQPAAKERIADAGRSSSPGKPSEKASADLRDLSTPAEHRKSTTAYITPESTLALDGKFKVDFKFAISETAPTVSADLREPITTPAEHRKKVPWR